MPCPCLGVGKSETAFRLAEAALAKAQRVGYSTRFLPNGLLMLRGEDFSAAAIGATLGSTPSSKAAAGGGGSGGGGGYVSGGWSESDTAQAAAEARHIIKSRIVEHLKTCQGNAVIVFDEVQKVLPGTLEVKAHLAFPYSFSFSFSSLSLFPSPSLSLMLPLGADACTGRTGVPQQL